MSKIPTPSELRERLSAGHFGKSRKVPPGDPVQPTPMVVPVTKIDLYDNNPRSVTNEKYYEIKESIRASGLEQPLSITRRPGAENYMVDAGGNTRLKILKELHQEFPDDRRFFDIHVLYQPWVSETHVLAKHLKENDLRGSLTFIDRARGIVKMRELLEQETGKPLSYRELSQALKEKGYSVSPGTITRLEYAATTLLPLIPLALEAGLGQHQVERIRRIEKALAKYLDFIEHEDKEGPIALWHECLAEVDTADETLPIERAYETLARRLESILKYANSQSILIDLDLLQAGKTISRYEPPPELRGEEATESATGSTGAAPPPSGASGRDVAGGCNTPADAGGSAASARPNGLEKSGAGGAPEVSGSLEGSGGAATAPEKPKASVSPLPTPSAERQDGEPFEKVGSAWSAALEPAPRPPLPSDPKSLRSRLWTQAMKLAKTAGLDHLVIPTPGAGAGYFIDLPEEPLSVWKGHPLGKDPYDGRKVGVWWLLMLLSEQSMAVVRQPDDHTRYVMPDVILKTRWLRHIIEHNSPVGFERLVGQPQYMLGIAMRLLSEREHGIFLDMLDAKAALVRELGSPVNIWFPTLDWQSKAEKGIEAEQEVTPEELGWREQP